MTLTLIHMTLVMACGTLWGVIRPVGLGAEETRQVLTSTVYYVFLPALILEVLWSADIGMQSVGFSILGVSSILSALILIYLVTRLLKFGRPQTGAILLATAFPNVTYLGLPVLEKTFGSWARSVAIQLDLFAAAPLVFTVGVMIARYYGEDEQPHKSTLLFLNTPPFWAALIAVCLNLNHIPVPLWLGGALKQLSVAVVPLMLFSLGLALSWRSVKLSLLPYIVPVIIIKLLLMPLFVIEAVSYLSMSDQHKAAAVIDLAMPSMMLGIIFCDRYKLDSALYAMAVTITTLLSILTLPFWYSQL
ncbi:MAG: AEC family transporter [Methylococcales bacterium]|nr:AEC family transporter [Methylococcales bacterium]